MVGQISHVYGGYVVIEARVRETVDVFTFHGLRTFCLLLLIV